MTPEEIRERASRVGVAVRGWRRCFADDPYPRSRMPFAAASDVHYVVVWLPGRRGFAVEDGMCRVVGREWLPWQTHGDAWCFLDDDPETVHPRLKESIWKSSR